jgi:hypothetical protein
VRFPRRQRYNEAGRLQISARIWVTFEASVLPFPRYGTQRSLRRVVVDLQALVAAVALKALFLFVATAKGGSGTDI